MNQEEAKKILIDECKRHYNKHECFNNCRCRQGTCIATLKDNTWNEELAEKIKERNDYY